ncbi:hypothetical protein [Larkinella humicola]|uniref:Uncharacterized protein n=1 Tax=Larkinella humicola TaxID=2607654 RepID=A0A5N1J8I0_9BACT|nr:hypothetical protein [Larkinella humicola]KAA9347789.1 hypothetical protein F0P93_24475 [Larkinella humicola]
MQRKYGSFGFAMSALVFLVALPGCRDVSLVDRPYQRLMIQDFSEPLRTVLPPYDGVPNSLTLRISGTISKPVLIAVDQFGGSQGRQAVRRDTLMAGTHTDTLLRGDYYSNQSTELTVTGATGTVGNLTIEWYRQ